MSGSEENSLTMVMNLKGFCHLHYYFRREVIHPEKTYRRQSKMAYAWPLYPDSPWRKQEKKASS